MQIPAGTTYYFELRGTLAGVTTGTSVSTVMNGDSAYTAATSFKNVTDFIGTAASAYADTNHSFIWSGNATSTATVQSNDWSDGFGILGLPANGLSQTRSQ